MEQPRGPLAAGGGDVSTRSLGDTVSQRFIVSSSSNRAHQLFSTEFKAYGHTETGTRECSCLFSSPPQTASDGEALGRRRAAGARYVRPAAHGPGEAKERSGRATTPPHPGFCEPRSRRGGEPGARGRRGGEPGARGADRRGARTRTSPAATALETRLESAQEPRRRSAGGGMRVLGIKRVRVPRLAPWEPALASPRGPDPLRGRRGPDPGVIGG